MIARTQEQEDADQRLYEAIVAHQRAYTESRSETEVMGDYIVVSHWTNLEGDPVDNYGLSTANGHIPDHVAKGLLEMGLDILTTDWSLEDDDNGS